MTKLWSKKGLKLNPAVNAYMISKNLEQDTILLPYDIQASTAHAKMLGKVGLLKKAESEKLVKTLEEILKRIQQGLFKLKQEDEDCHTTIENYLVEKLGETGKKIHMGRSRNDQVLVAMRLYTKDYLIKTKKSVLEMAKTILSFAKKYEFVPMPGYTHTQQAMPSSVGQWAGSFVESLLDDCDAIAAAINMVDCNPLGSAAGFGTALPIDRDYTTKLLGFSRTQINSIYCQNSRGKMESFVLAALLQVMMSLGKIANDLVWFTSQEFNFFNIAPEFTTGSSIMPQKRNLDIMEVLRANVSVIFANQTQVQSAGHNLLSGYNKDLKITKKALMDSFDITLSSMDITDLLFKNITPNKERLSKSMTPGIFATDEANRLAVSGIPFRDAYKKVGESISNVKTQNAEKNIRSKKHIGATGNLSLDVYEKMIKNKSLTKKA